MILSNECYKYLFNLLNNDTDSYVEKFDTFGLIIDLRFLDEIDQWRESKYILDFGRFKGVRPSSNPEAYSTKMFYIWFHAMKILPRWASWFIK